MANLVRWDPFAELESMRRTMDRFFGENFGRPGPGDGGEGSYGYVPVDMYETEDRVVVTASLPGVKPEDVDVSVTGESVTIKGEIKPEEHEEKGRNWYRREHRWGSFVRQLTLPTQVETERASANFENGVLTLEFPRAEAVKPKTIKVTPHRTLESGDTGGSQMR